MCLYLLVVSVVLDLKSLQTVVCYSLILLGLTWVAVDVDESSAGRVCNEKWYDNFHEDSALDHVV